MKYTDKIRMTFFASKCLGRLIPVEFIRKLPNEDFGGEAVVNNRGYRIEVADNLPSPVMKFVVRHEIHHVKIWDQARRYNLDKEYAEARKIMDVLEPGFSEAIYSRPPPLDDADNEAMAQLADRFADRQPLPPLSANLRRLLSDVTTPRPRALAARLAAPFIAAALIFAPVAALAMPGINKVNPGAELMINAYNDCKIVKNDGAAPVMVPTRSPQEWDSGQNSLIANVNKMPGISIYDCQNPPTDSCFVWVSGIGAAPVNHRPSMRAQIGDTSLIWEADRSGRIAGSDIIGRGYYSDIYGTREAPGVMHRAHNGTFDSIAVGASTAVEFYANENFEGPVSFRVTGPRLLINEHYFRDGAPFHYSRVNWLNEDWSGHNVFIRQFSPATRQVVNDSHLLVALPHLHEFNPDPGNAAPLTKLGKGSMKVMCN